MAQVRITLDQDLLDTLQAQADQAGLTLSALIAEKMQFAPAAANAATQDAFTLDQATEAFLRALQPGHGDGAPSGPGDGAARHAGSIEPAPVRTPPGRDLPPGHRRGEAVT